MADLTSNNSPTGGRRALWMLPGLLTAILAGLVILPVIAVVLIAASGGDEVWSQLWSTTLPRYLWTTVVLAASVGLLTAFVGAGTAWIVTVYDFPGRWWLRWALFAPLAVPAYVSAYAITDFLEYAGPVQTWLRGAFGWSTAADYWFFEVRSRGMATVVLASVLYPYVYLLTRAALSEQSGAVYDVARSLGTGGWRLFWRIGLPLARPAIAVGAAIAMMETVADFGVVDYFAVQTLTTGIFAVWLEQANAPGAAQIALCAVAVILVLVTLERLSRRNMRFYQTGAQQRVVATISLRGFRAWAAFAACFLPVGLGFLLPVIVMASHATGAAAGWADAKLALAFWHSVYVGGAVALLTVGAGVLLVYSVRLTGARWHRYLLPATSIGYALPGAVLGLGVLLPLAALDHRLADAVLALTGFDPGLMLTGTAFAVIFACCVRFFAIAQGAADGAMGRISPSLPQAARTLGRTPRGALRAVYLPLMRPSIATALLLVFVDTVKELPMTLFLRPFNFDTLATRVYEQASLEKIGAAAPPALTVTALGLIAVVLIVRNNR